MPVTIPEGCCRKHRPRKPIQKQKVGHWDDNDGIFPALKGGAIVPQSYDVIMERPRR